MTPNSEFLALCFVAVLLFGALIFFGIKAGATRQRAALRDTTARNVFERIRQAFPLTHLLYGIWQTGLTEVRLIVKDSSDRPVGTVVKETFSTFIEVDNARFDVIPGSTWNQSSELVAHDSSQVRARFERVGSLLRPMGMYSLDNGHVFTLQKNSFFSLLILIFEGEKQVGWVRDLQPGSVRVGRAISLPNSIPLEVRLFILSEGMGSRRG